jgi:chitinase
VVAFMRFLVHKTDEYQGYWDNIVAAAGEGQKKTRRRRSLNEVNRNHKRWLEEEWNDDFHLDKLSHPELHRRWFGKNILDWLNGLFKTEVKTDVGLTKNIQETFTAILLHEKYECQMEYGKMEGILDARASATVDISTTFGMTIITTLSLPLDLSQSYLYFKNKGEVTAVFKLDARGNAIFDSGDFELANIPVPGAGFRIPKIMSVGPSFRLYASTNAEINMVGTVEARVKIAQWDIKQTYPIANDDYAPRNNGNDMEGGANIQDLMKPEFDYRVAAEGMIAAHLKPALSFGLEIDPYWMTGGNAKVELLADAYVRVDASAEYSSDPNSCQFQYGVRAGGRLIARAEAPKSLKWGPATYALAEFEVPIVQGGNCPSRGRWLDGEWVTSPSQANLSLLSPPSSSSLGKRGQV